MPAVVWGWLQLVELGVSSMGSTTAGWPCHAGPSSVVVMAIFFIFSRSEISGATQEVVGMMSMSAHS